MEQLLGFALPGVPYGCTYALVAVCLVLTYQATGVFNFAFGAQAYASAFVFTYLTQYKNWSQTSLDTTLGTLRAAGMQGQQLQNEQAVLTALKASLQSTNGQQQALQALGDVSEQQVEQLMKLRQLMMADMSSKQAYQAAMIQQHAVSEGAAQRFFTYSPATSDGQKFGPGWN